MIIRSYEWDVERKIRWATGWLMWIRSKTKLAFKKWAPYSLLKRFDRFKFFLSFSSIFLSFNLKSFRNIYFEFITCVPFDIIIQFLALNLFKLFTLIKWHLRANLKKKRMWIVYKWRWCVRCKTVTRLIKPLESENER